MQINEKYFDKQLFLQDEIDIILEFLDIGKIIELDEILKLFIGLIQNSQKCTYFINMRLTFCQVKKYKEGFAFKCIKCRSMPSIYQDSWFLDRTVSPKMFKILLILWSKFTKSNFFI